MEKKKKVVKKRFLKIPALVLAAAFVLSFSFPASALSEELIPLGRTTGMKFFSQGAVIIGFSEIDGVNPAKDSGMIIGDKIISIDGKPVYSNESLANGLAMSNDLENVSIIAQRDGVDMTFSVKAKVSSKDNLPKIGAWVRDSMAGIGTITFVDPKTGRFAALGHGVLDVDTKMLMPMTQGALMKSTVTGVTKGKEGQPGELKGSFELRENQGSLDTNSTSGVYGQLSDPSLYEGQKAYPTAGKTKIVKGPAYILSNVNGEDVEQFNIEIIKVYSGDDPQMRDMMIKITDERLLSLTGGIVQGMSGSPIIQNDRLIGAVTHVLISDPQRGYGISIENMLDKAQAVENSVG